MPSHSLRKFYLLLSILAGIACWYQNVAYLPLGPLAGTWRFIQDAFSTPASSSLTLDIIFYFAAGTAFMWTESRRLKIPHFWAYVVFGIVIAISVTFPLFLMAREKKLRPNGNWSG